MTLFSAKALLKLSQHKQKPRNVLLFSKADWPNLKSKMKVYQQSFISNHLGKTVEELWTDFTTTLDKFSQECIPSKLIRGKSSLPWITQEIKRLIRKRDGLYSNFLKKQVKQTYIHNFRLSGKKSKEKLKTHTRLISKISWDSTMTKTNATTKNYSHF